MLPLLFAILLGSTVADPAPRTESVHDASPIRTSQLSVDVHAGRHRLQGPEGQLLRESPRPISQARLLEVRGTRIALWQEEGQGERASVQVPGSDFARPRRLDPLLHLRRGAFDPLVAVPEEVPDLLAPSQGGLHIVQLATPSLADVRAELAAAGAELLRFLPARAHIVRADAACVQRLEQLACVRWVGPYEPAHRLAPDLLEGLMLGGLPARDRYLVQLVRSGIGEQQSLASFVQSIGGTTATPSPRGMFLDAWLSPTELRRVVARDEVLYIDRHGEARSYMDKVRVDGGADVLESLTGFTGQGVRGEVLDNGFDVAHPDFQLNPPLVHVQNNTASQDHGTAVAGVVFGTGATRPTARGLLPDGQMIVSSYVGYLAGSGNGDRYLHTEELLEPPFEACFQSNSWGLSLTQDYTNLTTQLDDIAFQNDIVILQAMANQGSQFADAFAWGKNVLSVGGIRHQNTLSTSDDAWANSGSRGPAADGRIKPDLCYWFDAIETTAPGAGHTVSFGGTSAATPAVAGYLGLFLQMWHEDVFGTSPGGATVFESRPKATLAKAALINTADQYPFQGGTDDLKRVHQGWGRPDVERLHEERGDMLFVNETEVLTELQSSSWQVEVQAGEPELRATMVYLDPPGTTSASQHRINDLDLRLTSPSGVQYWGNRLMKTNMFTQPGGAANSVDTVENVWIQDPEVGQWTVEVIASEVNADARVETPGVDDVDFALVVSGIRGDGCVAPVVSCTSTPSSTGQNARLGSSGSVSVSANDLVLHATELPAQQEAILFYGPNSFSTPFGNGVLCVGGPYGRVGLRVSDALGSASWALDNLSPRNSFSQITPGSRWTFQVWFRDPAAGGAGFDLSDALEIDFCD